MPAKRRRDSVDGEDAPITTPKKLRFGEAACTPSKGTPTKSALKHRIGSNGATVVGQNWEDGFSTPKRGRVTPKSALVTPVKQSIETEREDGDNRVVVRNADRSARRKTNKNLMERTIAGDLSDDEQDSLAQQIWDEDGAEGAESDTEAEQEQGADGRKEVEHQITDPATPSKRGRGRPKGSKNKRTPTPPPDMPAHERYFFQNRPAASKSSSNTLSSFTLLSHSAYHDAMSAFQDRHAPSIASLHALHAASFPLWAFELSQGFTLCLYGYGAKSRLLTSFADHLHAQKPTATSPPITVIVNGHHPSLTLRSLLLTVASGLDLPASSLPTSVPGLLATIAGQLSSRAPNAPPVYLLLSGLTARVLTVTPGPGVLSTLAAHPCIRTVLTASTPTFPLLWPSSTRDALNILFHDATTFQPYDSATGTGTASELGTGVVDAVAELLGKRGPEAAGRERVRWVLKSLPENARGLYRILVAEILAAADTSGDRAEDDGASEIDEGDGHAGAGAGRPGTEELPCVDAKLVYQKASEEFLCSSEMAFHGLLREFVDHAMVVLRRDDGAGAGSGGGGSGGRGGEVLGVDMGREELEGVLEDLLA